MNLLKPKQKLVEGLNKLSSFNKLFKVFSIGSIFWIAFTERLTINSSEEIDGESMQHFRKLYHSLLENGIYFGPSGYEVGFVSAAHTDSDIEKTIEVFSKALRS